MLGVYLILQNITQQQQLLPLTFLCYWRILSYCVLPRPAESWFEIHYNQRIIPENFFYCQFTLKWNTFNRLFKEKIQRYLQREDKRFRFKEKIQDSDCATPEKVLVIEIYRLTHGGSFENTGVAMNAGKTAAIEPFLFSSGWKRPGKGKREKVSSSMIDSITLVHFGALLKKLQQITLCVKNGFSSAYGFLV